MVGTFLFFAFGYVVIMGIEGPSLLAHTQWPAVSSMRLINITSFLINKLGLLVIVFWGLFVLAFVSVRIWCLGHDVPAAVPVPAKGWYRGLLLLFGVLAFFWSGRFANVVELQAFAQGWILPWIVGYDAVYPLLILLGAVVRSALLRRRRPAPV